MSTCEKKARCVVMDKSITTQRAFFVVPKQKNTTPQGLSFSRSIYWSKILYNFVAKNFSTRILWCSRLAQEAKLIVLPIAVPVVQNLVKNFS